MSTTDPVAGDPPPPLPAAIRQTIQDKFYALLQDHAVCTAATWNAHAAVQEARKREAVCEQAIREHAAMLDGERGDTHYRDLAIQRMKEHR